MATKLRSHGKTTVYWVLLAFLVLGLGGFGASSFGGGTGTIGRVGKTDIEQGDYLRRMSAEMRARGAETGTTLTLAQARAQGLEQLVQSQLFAAAALDEANRRLGVSVGDGEVRRQILDIAAFKTPAGTFDREAYRDALRRQGQTEARFEAELRRESARLVLAGAAQGGVVPPAPMRRAYLDYVAETRDLDWVEVTAQDLPGGAVAEPDEAALKAHHAAHAERYRTPETRKLTYVWLTPDMIAETVTIDEAAVRALYEQRKAEFVQPERRLVERLVYPDRAAAEAAKARFDAGATFEDLARDRGLTLEDADLGEVTREDLGAAGEAVFALAAPGVVGPLDTDLGPALYAMNAVLEAKTTSFEEAQEELAGEARMERARRVIADAAAGFEDELAGGVTLEEIAKGGDLKLGTLDYTAGTDAGIAGYEGFRAAAEAATEEDFPEIRELSDGGIFALRLDALVPPAPIPFETARDAVALDWRKEAQQAALVARAEAVAAAVSAGGALGAQGLAAAPVAQPGLARGAFVEGAPAGMVTRAFALARPGQAAVAEGEDKVAVVRLGAIHAPDPAAEATAALGAQIDTQLGQAIAQDMTDYFIRAIEAEAGVTLDQGAAAAALSRLQ